MSLYRIAQWSRDRSLNRHKVGVYLDLLKLRQSSRTEADDDVGEVLSFSALDVNSVEKLKLNQLKLNQLNLLHLLPFLWLQKVSSCLGTLELKGHGLRRQPWLTKAIRTKRRDPSFDGSQTLARNSRVAKD
jgi:hypothetical protein